MTHSEVALLSLLQGATEFLPVSSSGHLQIAQRLADLHGSHLGVDNISLVVLVHVGTLLAILWVFRKRIAELSAYAFAGGWGQTREAGWRPAWLERPEGRLILAIVIANIPTAITGLLLEDFFDDLYADPSKIGLVGWALCFSAIMLAATHWRRPSGDGKTQETDFPLWMALVVGLAQSVALVPGISRSGATIATALLLGMHRRTAGEFSFLIAIPAIFGAMLLKFVAHPTLTLPPAVCLNALAVSALTGYVFLRLLLRFVQGGRLWYFAVYCAIVGLWTIWYF